MSGYIESGISPGALDLAGPGVLRHVETQLARRLGTTHADVAFTWYAQVKGAAKWTRWTAGTPYPAGAEQLWCRAIASGGRM